MFPFIKTSCEKSFEENARDSLLTDSNNIIFLGEYKNEEEHRKEDRKDGKRRETRNNENERQGANRQKRRSSAA